MRLLEREDALLQGEAAFAQASDGSGQVLLVSGEAGIGKSCFVTAFRERIVSTSIFLSGGCDQLSTPRPYGPFIDLARHAFEGLAEALEDGDLSSALGALLDGVAREDRPVVLAIEDVHWADHASLDLLTALGRRIGELRLLLLLTYRDLPRGHPAVGLIGGIPAALARRIDLAPLSIAAVSQMAGEPIAPGDDLYASTKGNPFFVSEMLAAREEGVPATVADAVLARAAALPPATRDVLDLISVIPGRMPAELLDVLDPDWLDNVEPAEERGIIEVGEAVQFRHDLARQAVDASLSQAKRRRISEAVLAALLKGDAPLAQVVHHARRAGAWGVVSDFAPRAGLEAAKAAAHQEAISHFLLAIKHRGFRSDVAQADLHDAVSRQLWFDGRQEEAMDHALLAIDLLEGAGERQRLGSALRSAANLAEWRGDSVGYRALEARAVEVLESIDPSADLAMLYADMGFRLTIQVEIARAKELLDRAVSIAERVGDLEALAVAYSSAAYHAHWVGGNAEAWQPAMNLQGPEVLEATVVAHCNRVFISIERGDDVDAQRFLREALPYLEQHQATATQAFAYLSEARLALKQGEWGVAEDSLELATGLVDLEAIGPAFRIERSYCAGRLAARRGDPTAGTLLDAAWAENAHLDQLGRRVAPAAASAELAELGGDLKGAVDRLRQCERILEQPGVPWAAEIAYWLWRADVFDGPVPTLDHPRYLSMKGEWQAAAGLWKAMGRPYEQAEALTRCDDVGRRLEGLAMLDSVGAAPLAAATRLALRSDGIRNVPRGPTRDTRSNPGGLTSRQLDVLALLTDGYTNAEIAEQLFVSVRTVDSHVGAILQKLGVSTRRAAARTAGEMGIT